MNIIIPKKSLLDLFKKASSDKGSYIHPWDVDEMREWSKRFGISCAQLNDAILDTGSLRIRDIKHYLKEKGVLFSFKRLWQHMHLNAFLY